MAYATVTQLKREVGIAAGDTSQDAYLADLLDWVSAWIDTYTGRTFVTGAQSYVEEYIRDSYARVVWLKAIDVLGITTVQAKDKQADSYETLTTDEFEWFSNGQIRLAQPARFVKVTYTRNLVAVPKDIEGACVQAAAKVYRNNSVAEEEIGDYRVKYSKPEDVFGDLGVLDAHRIRGV